MSISCQQMASCLYFKLAKTFSNLQFHSTLFMIHGPIIKKQTVQNTLTNKYHITIFKPIFIKNTAFNHLVRCTNPHTPLHMLVQLDWTAMHWHVHNKVPHLTPVLLSMTGLTSCGERSTPHPQKKKKKTLALKYTNKVDEAKRCFYTDFVDES